MMLIFFCDKEDKLKDGFLIHSILQLAKTLHDKIDFMSEEREVKRVSNIISRLVKKVDHGKDLDKTLNVFTEARGLFINLDQVTETLIFETINLAVRCHAYCKGRHNAKTLNFVKACIAYAHITIPTLEDIEKQISLFLLTSQVALLNGLIGETDSVLRQALIQVDENFSEKKEDLDKIADTLVKILGFLVIVPSNPEDNFF